MDDLEPDAGPGWRGGFFAQAVGDRPFDLAYLQRVLGCSPDAALRLCLCRLPRADWWELDLRIIAAYVGVEVEALRALRPPRGTAVAAVPPSRTRVARLGPLTRRRVEVRRGLAGWLVWLVTERVRADGAWEVRHAEVHGPWAGQKAAELEQDRAIRATRYRRLEIVS